MSIVDETPDAIEAIRSMWIAENGTTGETTGDGADPSADGFEEVLQGWTPVALNDILAGNHEAPRPELLAPEGGTGLFYRGGINCLYGDSGTGKSWIAAQAAKEEIEQGGRVLWVDLEATGLEMVARLRAIGLSDESVRHGLCYVRPENAIGPTVAPFVQMLIQSEGITMVVVDSLGEAFAIESINEDRDTEVAPWIRKTIRAICLPDVIVLVIDHSTKSRDNALYPSGSKRKRAAWTGAGYLVDAKPSFSKQTPGSLTLTCAKDRHGTYSQGTKVVRICVEPKGDGALSLTSHSPSTEAAHPKVNLADRARPIVEHLRQIRDEAVETGKSDRISRNQLIAQLRDNGTKVRSEDFRAAIDWAEREAFLDIQEGPRNAHLIGWVRDMPSIEG